MLRHPIYEMKLCRVVQTALYPLLFLTALDCKHPPVRKWNVTCFLLPLLPPVTPSWKQPWPRSSKLWSSVSGVLKATPRTGDSLKGWQDSAYSCITAMTYYSKRTQSKISKGEGGWDKIQRKPGTSFQESSPSGVMQGALVVLSPREAP